jgi:prolyl-tRNA editing enzyme YbaK/EbsC (Cys-tRNA(Pro) deacylase)
MPGSSYTMMVVGTTRLETYLRERGVRFDVIAHARTETATAEARAADIPAEQTAKTVLLRTPHGYRLAVVSASDRLDPQKAADALDLSRNQVRLATESDMAADFSSYAVGAIPPVGPDAPAELFDRRLLEHSRVLCPAGDHEHSLLLNPADIVRLTGARTVDIRED